MRKFNVVLLEKKIRKLNLKEKQIENVDGNSVMITDENCLSVWGGEYNYMKKI